MLCFTPFSFLQMVSWWILCRRLGWDCKSGESHLDAMLRGEILIVLVLFGHEVTQTEAVKRFHAFIDDRNTSLLPPDVRKVVKFKCVNDASNFDRYVLSFTCPY